jgi:hypothetical protein
MNILTAGIITGLVSHRFTLIINYNPLRMLQLFLLSDSYLEMYQTRYLYYLLILGKIKTITKACDTIVWTSIL